MIPSFNDTLDSDHLNMLSSNEFGTICLNTRTTETFDIVKTDAFIRVSDDGFPITEDAPMFNTSLKMVNDAGAIIATDIKQDDVLTIESKNFIVRGVRKDGIGGIDIYLKD